MRSEQQWIWQQPAWPKFCYNSERLLPLIATASRLIGALEATCRTLADPVLLDARETVLADDAMETSAIEGEILRRSSVRASVRKRLGLPVGEDDSDSQSDGLVAMLLDARNNCSQPLTEERLYSWQAALFPTGYSGLRQIHVGGYRGPEQMQIVSGPLDRERVHYIAPPRERLDHEMSRFLSFVNQANDSDPILNAGIAHLWFIMIHPFDDGNGRVGRAITDALLARNFPLLMQVISFSKQVSLDKKEYYRLLEEAGQGGLDLTDWLLWFGQTLITALHKSQWIIEQVVHKTLFWHKHGKTMLNARQQKVLNRLLEAGDQFTGGMTTRKYAGMCKCSKVTASRDLTDLETKGLMRKRSGSGRSTSYEIVS
ncbi:MAG: hypothetical protein A2511_11310 [Deltaproteobacteria bacterium RIFOXYD12_FULL_50_9]|nr:MAG: hypothetical protein A2511_11310 [Deltaproteobacteria bacterium RIFOXYD12_FULL_50_9]